MSETRFMGPQLTTKYVYEDESTNVEFPMIPEESFSYVTVSIKVKQHSVKQFKIYFCPTLSGQIHTFCNCTDITIPLIITGRPKTDKRKCMILNCNGMEQYICCKYSCNTTICGKCFKKLSPTNRTLLNPPNVAHYNDTYNISMNEDEDYNDCYYPVGNDNDEYENIDEHCWKYPQWLYYQFDSPDTPSHGPCETSVTCMADGQTVHSLATSHLCGRSNA